MVKVGEITSFFPTTLYFINNFILIIKLKRPPPVIICIFLLTVPSYLARTLCHMGLRWVYIRLRAKVKIIKATFSCGYCYCFNFDLKDSDKNYATCAFCLLPAAQNQRPNLKTNICFPCSLLSLCPVTCAFLLPT